MLLRHDLVFLRPVRLLAPRLSSHSFAHLLCAPPLPAVCSQLRLAELPEAQLWFAEHCCPWRPSLLTPGVVPTEVPTADLTFLTHGGRVTACLSGR